MHCAVLNCKRNNRKSQKGVKFFRFPKDEKLCQQWLDFCGRKDISVDDSVVCNIHFQSTDFERDLQYEMGFIKRFRPKLLPNAVPKIISKSMKGKTIQKPPGSRETSKYVEITSNTGNVRNNTDEDPLLLDIKVEPERIVDQNGKPIDEFIAIKTEREEPFFEMVSIKKEPEVEEQQISHESTSIPIIYEISELTQVQSADVDMPPVGEIVSQAVQSDLHPMQILRKQVISLKKENTILRKAAKKQMGDIRDLSNALKRSEFQRSNMEKNLRLIFTEGQIKKIKNGSEKRLVWNDEDLKKAAKLYSLSRKAYDFLQTTNFPLPSVRTIQNFVRKGRNDETDQTDNEESNDTERVLYKTADNCQASPIYDIYKINKSCSKKEMKSLN